MKIIFLLALAAGTSLACAQAPVATEDHGYMVFQVPALRRDEAPKVVVEKILAQVKNESGQTIAFELADERGRVLVQADHLKGLSIIPKDKIVDFIRTQPREKLIEFTWGTLQGDLDAMKHNDLILTKLIIAARTRSNFAKTRLGSGYGMALVGLSLVSQPKVAELLDEIANQTTVEMPAWATVRNVVRESVDAEAAQ